MEWLREAVFWSRLIPAITASIGLFVFVRKVWRESMGESRFIAKRYRRLAPGVRHKYVKELFGEPAWQSTDTWAGFGDEEVTSVFRTWALGKKAYLVTCSYDTGWVWGYSITTRSRTFRPKITIGPPHDPIGKIKLGKTRLADLPRCENDARYASVGARRYAYAQTYYLGNPGGYQTWAVGVSDAGRAGVAPVGLYDAEKDEWGETAWEEYTRSAVINSVLVAKGTRFEDASILPWQIGPDHDQVRLLETPSWITLKRWRLQERRARRRTAQAT